MKKITTILFSVFAFMMPAFAAEETAPSRRTQIEPLQKLQPIVAPATSINKPTIALPKPPTTSSATLKNDQTPTKSSQAGSDSTTTGTDTDTGTDTGTDTDTNTPEMDQAKQAEIAELQANADAMKAKERSTANKVLGAASIGATSYGLSQAMQGSAEKATDERTESEMRSFISSMYCDYGTGKTERAGAMNIELPGGNALFDMYNEYTELADSLKFNKEQLGMAPGIESETLMDKATAGLYDDEGTKTGGAGVTSVYRALTNTTGTDATEWATQKDQADSTQKTGLIVAGAGVAGGIIGNLALNTVGDKGKNIFGNTVAQERSAEINAKYKSIYKALDDLKKNVEPPVIEPESFEIPDTDIAFNDKLCPNGLLPLDGKDCECGPNEVYESEPNKCTPCGAGKIVKNGQCVCDAQGGYLTNTDTNTCVKMPAKIVPQCDTNLPNIIVLYDGSCDCENGYKYNKTLKQCECLAPMRESNGVCHKVVTDVITEKVVETVEIINTVEVPVKLPTSIDISGSNLFDSGKTTIKPKGRDAIMTFVGQVKQVKDFNGCITITGHTDLTGTEYQNKVLSEQRAQAVANLIKSQGLDAQLVSARGYGWDHCTPDFRNDHKAAKCSSGAKACSACRRVNLDVSETTCTAGSI